MILANPILDKVAKLLGLLDEFSGVALAHEVGGVVAQLVSLDPATVQVCGKRGGGGAEGGLQGTERVVVGASRWPHAVTCGPDGLGGQGPGGVVGHAELSIDGKTGQGGILEVAARQSPKPVKLLLACGLGRDSSLL